MRGSNPDAVRVFRFTLGDAISAAALHRRVFEHPWSEADFRRFTTEATHLALAARLENELCGFIIVSVAAGEGEILTIAVAPEWQGRGIGSVLIGAACQQARARDSLALFLEVREDNHAARRLYAKHSAMTIGRRPGYYATRDGLRDALLMRLDLKEPVKGAGLRVIR